MNNENKTPQWLINIQENSWNVELFISIGFVYVLFKLPQLTDNLAENIIANYGVFTNFGNIRFIIQLALFVLPIGFITHLVFRGIWIGLVGFSYVFPEGIRTEKLDYPEKYKIIINKSKDPISIIVSLEKICSMIYTFTFLFFFILLAVFNYLLITGLILEGINYIFDNNKVFIIFRILFLFLGLLYAFDFFTTGLIKRGRFTAGFFYPIYRTISFITFSKLYRTQYYTLITEYNKLRVSLVLFIGLIGYVIISFVNTKVKTDNRELYSNTFYQHYLINSSRMYENLLPSGELFSNAFIQSDIIQDNFLKLFVCHKRYYEQIYLGHNIENLRMNIKELENQGDVKVTYRFVNTEINDLYKVYIDDELVDSIEWYYNIHPKTISNGVVSYIDIACMSKGHHNVKIMLPDSSQLTSIHFWKQ